MPSTRPKLILDEESFQGLLAAAFTIQQYNQREGGIDAALSAELNATLGAAAPAPKNGGAAHATGTVEREREEQTPAEPSVTSLPERCGSALLPWGDSCSVCEAETFRPGERLQRTWATMWSISQEKEQGSSAGPNSLVKSQTPEAAPNGDSGTIKEATGNLVFHDATSHDAKSDGVTSDEESLRILPADVVAAAVVPDPQARSLTLRFRRADLYLGLAILVALVALFWPAASSGRNELRPWERVLVAIGIAEAPSSQAEVHYSGDPNIKVWVDTHAALYYCPGDDLYGKSSGGYYTTQHDAQLDRFEPALRQACVP